MPMHDWTRVKPNPYHAFHLAWLAALQQALNTGVLPAGYYALADQSVPPVSSDVRTLQVPPTTEELPPGPGTSGNGGAQVLTTSPPRVQFSATESSRMAERPLRRIAVRDESGNRLVAVIEIVSPANKRSNREFRRFLNKTVSLLLDGIHLLVVDPFPPTARDPRGLHAAIWKALVRKADFTPPAGKPLTLASYAVGPDEFTAYVEPIASGDVLPDMPLFLTPDGYVSVPLERTYHMAWQGFPPPLRRLLERDRPAG